MDAPTPPDPDAPLLERLERLYPAVISDELDRIGLRHQVMRPDIRPLFPGARVVGRAFTLHAVPVFSIPEAPYRLEMEAVDRLRPGDVLCVSTIDASFWGELLSTAAQARGCRGVVVDGYTRDTRAIVAMGFPTFVRGVHMADSLGRVDVIAFGTPIECGGVAVRPGDFLFGDDDGVVVLPRECAEEVIARAEEKRRGENQVREHLRQGMSVAEAFRRFGIL